MVKWLKLALWLLFWTRYCRGSIPNAKIRAIPVFRPEESDYHKYSAVLAATEPFRLQRDEDLKRCLSPIAYFFHRLKGTVLDPASLNRIENKAIDIACSRYEKKVDEIVRSYGMTAEQFNSISQKLLGDPILKKKVILQSYFYRIAADLELNTRENMPILPAVCQSPSKMSKKSTALLPNVGNESIFLKFCKAIRSIEDQRLQRLKVLQIELEVPKLPPNMCDPEMMPLLCDRIKAASAEFPHLAKVTLQQHGLCEEEFAQLQQRLRRDPIFRMRVDWQLRALDKTASEESISNLPRGKLVEK